MHCPFFVEESAFTCYGTLPRLMASHAVNLGEPLSAGDEHVHYSHRKYLFRKVTRDTGCRSFGADFTVKLNTAAASRLQNHCCCSTQFWCRRNARNCLLFDII